MEDDWHLFFLNECTWADSYWWFRRFQSYNFLFGSRSAEFCSNVSLVKGSNFWTEFLPVKLFVTSIELWFAYFMAGPALSVSLSKSVFEIARHSCWYISSVIIGCCRYEARSFKLIHFGIRPRAIFLIPLQPGATEN